MCSFVEIYFLTEANFYSYNGTLNTESKKLKTIFSNLETNRDFNLTLNLVRSASVILGLFKLYFAKYLHDSQENNNELSDALESIKDFSVLERKSSLLYQIVKRLSVHLNLIVKYEVLNQHKLLDLVQLFENLMLGKFQNGFTFNLDRYAVDCSKLFNLSPDFFIAQYTMIDRLFSLKSTAKPGLALLHNRFKFTNYLVKVYAGDRTSTRFFQTMIDEQVTGRNILERARREFEPLAVAFSRYSLFETADSSTLLERVLPIDVVLIQTLSNWRPFVLVVKENYLDDEIKRDETLGFFDSCNSVGICQKCQKYAFLVIFRHKITIFE